MEHEEARLRRERAVIAQLISALCYKLARKKAWGAAYNIELQQRAAKQSADAREACGVCEPMEQKIW